MALIRKINNYDKSDNLLSIRLKFNALSAKSNMAEKQLQGSM